MTRDQRLALLLSVLRSRGVHWLEDHPEEAPRTWVDHLVGGFATLFGPPLEPWDPMVQTQEILARAWAKACIQTADQVAAEHGLELRTYSRSELSWWEALLAVEYGTRRRTEDIAPPEES